MALCRWAWLGVALAGLVSTGAEAADATTGTIVTPPVAPDATKLLPTAPVAPGTAPLVGLDSGSFALVPPGSAAAARNDGLAGSPSSGVDLSYIPPAERDSYLNSHDFADHLQTSTRGGHHPSALSQLGGAGEAMAINGLLGAGTSLVLGGH